MTFEEKLKEVAAKLGIHWLDLKACIAFETGHTFSPSIRNKVSGATGLIQFMKPTAKELGTTQDALAKMTDVEQLDYVYKYLVRYKSKLRTVEDIYMAILYPKAAGKPLNYVLFNSGVGKAYLQNKGLDLNKDGVVTKGEASAKVRKIRNSYK
jgi:hypothetical protein